MIMPLLIVNDDQWAAALKDTNDEKLIEHHILQHGRGNTAEVPSLIREIVAEDAIENGSSAKSLSTAFGVSESSVNAYKNGATSTATYRQKDPSLQAAKRRVYNRASNRLIAALDALKSKDLSGEKAKDISSIAKDMSSVLEKVKPHEVSDSTNQVHLHLYAPKLKQLSDYDEIVVNAVSPDGSTGK
jgi:hypothetical protein